MNSLIVLKTNNNSFMKYQIRNNNINFLIFDKFPLYIKIRKIEKFYALICAWNHFKLTVREHRRERIDWVRIVWSAKSYQSQVPSSWPTCSWSFPRVSRSNSSTWKRSNRWDNSTTVPAFEPVPSARVPRHLCRLPAW